MDNSFRILCALVALAMVRSVLMISVAESILKFNRAPILNPRLLLAIRKSDDPAAAEEDDPNTAPYGNTHEPIWIRRYSWKYLRSNQSAEQNCKKGIFVYGGKENDNYGQSSSTYKGYQNASDVVHYYVIIWVMTFQAGLKPPGGFWSTDGSSLSGDPVLLSGKSSAGYGSTMAATIRNTCEPIWDVVACASAPLLDMIGSLRFLISWIVSYHENTSASDLGALLLVLIILALNFVSIIITTSVSITLNREALFRNGKSMSIYVSESDPAAAEEDDPNTAPYGNTRREPIWLIAFAAAHHMTGDLSLLLTGEYWPMDTDEDIFVPTANPRGKPLRVRGSGSVRTESIALDDVWYVPGLDSNLVSTGQLARQLGCATTLGPGGCRITRGDALVGNARFADGYLFELDFLKVPSSKK